VCVCVILCLFVCVVLCPPLSYLINMIVFPLPFLALCCVSLFSVVLSCFLGLPCCLRFSCCLHVFLVCASSFLAVFCFNILCFLRWCVSLFAFAINHCVVCCSVRFTCVCVYVCCVELRMSLTCVYIYIYMPVLVSCLFRMHMWLFGVVPSVVGSVSLCVWVYYYYCVL